MQNGSPELGWSSGIDPDKEKMLLKKIDLLLEERGEMEKEAEELIQEMKEKDTAIENYKKMEKKMENAIHNGVTDDDSSEVPILQHRIRSLTKVISQMQEQQTDASYQPHRQDIIKALFNIMRASETTYNFAEGCAGQCEYNAPFSNELGTLAMKTKNIRSAVRFFISNFLTEDEVQNAEHGEDRNLAYLLTCETEQSEFQEPWQVSSGVDDATLAEFPFLKELKIEKREKKTMRDGTRVLREAIEALRSMKENETNYKSRITELEDVIVQKKRTQAPPIDPNETEKLRADLKASQELIAAQARRLQNLHKTASQNSSDSTTQYHMRKSSTSPLIRNSIGVEADPVVATPTRSRDIKSRSPLPLRRRVSTGSHTISSSSLNGSRSSLSMIK